VQAILSQPRVEINSDIRTIIQESKSVYLRKSPLPILVVLAKRKSISRRAIALGRDEVKDAHRFLGAIYLQRGERERGVAELETYLKLAPKARDAEQVRQIVRQNKH